MKIERFTDLRVWKQAHELTLLIYKLSETFPSSERFGMVSQIRRSASAVPANIAEGFGRRTTRELLRCMQIARGELEETRYFLILARDLGHVRAPDFERATAGCDSVGKLINALGSSLKKRLLEN
ncbi:MAG: four helix bundle protein [Candidatus Acidiferrales bacterium]